MSVVFIIQRQVACKSITIKCSPDVMDYCLIPMATVNLPEEDSFYIVNENRWRPVETILQIRPMQRSYIASIDSIWDNFPKLQQLFISNALNSIPSMKYAGSLKVLNFRNNFIKDIVKFALNGAANLEVIDLSSNAIRSIENEAFSGLSRLTSIDMKNNQLRSLSNRSFSGATSLSYINLQNNSIMTIEDGCFALSHLTELNMANNLLETISDYIFDGAIGLKKVSLAHNRIKVVRLIIILQSVPIESFNIQDNNLGMFENQTIKCTSNTNVHLKSLDLSKNQLRGKDIFDRLKCLPNLQMLIFNGNKFTRFDNVSDLRVYFPHLFIIHLIDNEMSCGWIKQTAFDKSLFYTRSIRRNSVNQIACVP